MDCSKFISEDFESKSWINDLISSIPPESLEKDVTDHVIKLQFYMQEMNTVVDDSIQNALQSLPRVLRDLDSVKQEAISLQEQMSLVKLEIEKVEKSTQDSMCSLLKIDSQKKKLCQVEKSLQEADSWTQICDNIDMTMQSGDLGKIVDKISSLQHSLSMLTAASDYDERKKKIDQLCLNFLSLLGPQLIQAFFNNNSDFIRTSFSHLSLINLTDSGCTYYIAWFKPHVADIWNNCLNDDNNHNDNSWNLLKTFYRKLITFCNEEIRRKLFTNETVVMINAVTEALNHLDSEFDKVVKDLVLERDRNSHSRLTLLSNCIKMADEFCTELELTFLDCVDSDNPPSRDSPSIKLLSSVIYNQYKTVYNIFGSDCKSYILQKLNNIKMDTAEISDCIDVLDQSVDKVIDLAREALKFCQLTTHFTAIDHLADIIKELFTVYIGDFKRVCVNITLKLSNQQISTTNKRDNIDSSIEDYYFLQDGIRLTSIGGHISSQFEQFIQEMLNQITNQIQELNSIKNKKRIFLRNYPDLLVESRMKQREISEFWQLISNTSSQINLLKLPFFTILEEARQSIKFQLLRWLNSTVFDSAIEPVKKCLGDIHKSTVWQEELETGEPLPQFAYSPQEYITRIGQFFMTLPQQLEPFLNENSIFYHESLLHGQLPHLSDSFLSQPIQVAHVWLESIIFGSLSLLLSEWLMIGALSTNGKQQLVADINYISGLVEDLGLPVNDDIKTLSTLLSSSSNSKGDMTEVIGSTGHLSPKIVQFIKKIGF